MTSPAISFCIITAGTRPALLETAIRSIRAQRIPECEIIVVGRHHEAAGIVYIPAEDHAAAGRLGAMRNLGVAAARYPNIALLDDDVVLGPDWYANFRAYGGDFDILTSQVRLPDGGRFWDHATCGGPSGHRILADGEEDDHLYMTGGGAWVMKQHVAQAVHWDDRRGFYDSEDVDFAARCRAHGFRISHNHRSVAFHADPTYTTVGRVVVRGARERTQRGSEGAACGLSAAELGRLAAEHMRGGRIAEAADCLRYGMLLHPGCRAFQDTWRELERVYGGPLPDARWSDTEDPEYLAAMAASRDAPGSERTYAQPPAPPRCPSGSHMLADSSEFGINIFGFLSGNLGLGVSGRAYLKLLLDSGVNVQPVEIELLGGRSHHDLRYAGICSTLDDHTPYPVNLFAMNPSDLAALLESSYRAVRTSRRINICLPFWELPRIPRSWIETLERMDIVIAASQFIRYALLTDLSGVSVPYSPHPVYLEEDISADRARWGVPADALMFFSAFEMASDTNRKNPFGAIEAFNCAFSPSDNAYLVVKINNARAFPTFETSLRQLHECAAQNPHVILVEEVLTYRDVLSLYASGDVFVSLHRAEGFGLCLAEAMSLGKPVIATAWSGNMDFMNEQNSCLVDYSLVPVRASTQAAYRPENIGANARWAEPQRDQAVRWMRRLAEDPELRERIGKQAAADMAARQRRMSGAAIIDAVKARIELRGSDFGGLQR